MNKPNSYQHLNEAAKKEMQKQFHQSDLDYFASYPFEQGLISPEDISDLNARIDRKTKSGSTGFNTLLALLCGVFIGATLFFAFFQDSLTHDAQYLPNEEIAVHPGEPAKKESVIPPVQMKDKHLHVNEHFSIHQAGEQLPLSQEEYPELEVKTVDKIEAREKTAEPEAALEYIPNAPVIFIHDLKVASYKSYYFKNNREINIDEEGLAAPFESRAQKTSGKTGEQNYYAHEIIRDALGDFNSKHYSNCIELLNLLYRYNKEDVNTLFYLGMCYYYTGNYAKAASFFDDVLDNRVNVFAQEAEFYKALSLQNNKQTEEARKALENIVSKKLFYKDRAAEALKKLQD